MQEVGSVREARKIISRSITCYLDANGLSRAMFVGRNFEALGYDSPTTFNTYLMRWIKGRRYSHSTDHGCDIHFTDTEVDNLSRLLYIIDKENAGSMISMMQNFRSE